MRWLPILFSMCADNDEQHFDYQWLNILIIKHQTLTVYKC